MRTTAGWAKYKNGFTIIEVMIFLAVSGFTFVLAVVFINGKQDNVAFRQGMEAAASTVTSTINAVANGEYPPLPAGKKCEATAGSAPSFSNDVAGDGQGTNSGCIFLGKVIQLGFGSPATSYKTFVVAARQYEAGSQWQPVQTFETAKPVAVDGAGVDLTQTSILENGLVFSKAYLCSGDCSGSGGSNKRTQIGGVGFFGSFGSYSAASANSQASGAQDVTVATLPTGDMDDNITRLKDNSELGSGQYVALCFNYGEETGSVTIGGRNGQQTDVGINFNRGMC